jgi:AICAR transformylase/IMP cyclohydrolase PurH
MGSSALRPDTSDGTGFPAWGARSRWDKRGLRYGENPHQQAALYRRRRSPLRHRRRDQLHGKEMSYNNYVDADAALPAAYDFDGLPTVAIIKHANPCGIAVGPDIAEAHRKAHACDPGVGVRRRDRHQPAGHAGDGRAGRRDLHRGGRRARLRGRARWRC